MNIQEKLEVYYKKQKEINALLSASALVYRDQSAMMPKHANSGRGIVHGAMAGVIHEKKTNASYLGVVDELYEHIGSLTPKDQRSISLVKKGLDKQRKLSKEFVQSFEELKSNAHASWIGAKENNDFKSFLPDLEQIFSMTKEYAAIVGEGKDPYDVLLDEYEEGSNQEYYDQQLLPLKTTVIDLVKTNTGLDDDISYDDIEIHDKAKLKAFLENIIGKIGFDFDKGLIGIVEHPFASYIGPNDERINTNLKMLLSSLTGMIHELGHGFYDVYSPEKFDRTNLSQGVSLGVHESQSRLLENIIGRSDPFISWLLPQLQETFDECASWTHAGLKATLNNVKPSLIRITADEVSYNLHILMRYEIEKSLMNGSVLPKDLPEVWNTKMKEYFGIQPTSDTMGCLQDVHWSAGLIGYFPTYMLGNIISGQLRDGFVGDNPNRENEVKNGNFTSYISWFNSKIRQHSSYYEPRELIKHATGAELTDTHYKAYLKEKYGQ